MDRKKQKEIADLEVTEFITDCSLGIVPLGKCVQRNTCIQTGTNAEKNYWNENGERM